MKRVELREHGRLEPKHAIAAATPGAASVPQRAYERLRRFDETSGRADASIFTWYATHAKASQWVGVMQVEGLQLEILPKIENEGAREARAALVTMLAYAGDIPLRLRDLAALLERHADLGELLAAVFAQRLLEELIRGPERAYVSRRENVAFLRGKLAVRKHLMVNAAHRERFLCDYDELASDTPLNQVLRAACTLLSNIARARGTLDLLERCLVVLDDVSDVVVTPESLGRVVLTRQSQRFAVLLEFCRMLFAGNAPTSQGGARQTFSLLFDMNKVFERFVAGFVAREVIPRMPDGWRAHVQARGRTRFLLRAGDRGVLRLQPDLLLERPDGKLVVVDTKWKRLLPGRERSSLSREDLYQLYAYTQRFDAARSILLFPHVDGVRQDGFDVLAAGDAPSGARLDVRFALLRGVEARCGRIALACALAEELAG